VSGWKINRLKLEGEKGTVQRERSFLLLVMIIVVVVVAAAAAAAAAAVAVKIREPIFVTSLLL